MIPMYKFSVETAMRSGEIDAWRESRDENIRCRDFIDNQVAENYNGYSMSGEFLEDSVKEFGFDRTIVGA